MNIFFVSIRHLFALIYSSLRLEFIFKQTEASKERMQIRRLIVKVQCMAINRAVSTNFAIFHH